MKNEITFIDPFAGIGGFRFGLEKSGEHLQGQSRNRKSLRSQGDKSGHKAPRSKSKPARRESKDYRCVWSNEWNKYCAKIYQKNFGEAPDTRDIRTVPSREIPDHDLLCAGFPCPTFSIAGKGKGFEDTRGTVFFEIPRILRDKRPRYFLLENVKGLLSHQAGQTFQTILGVLADLGYRCEWQVLNSKDFGVPQNRERVFVVGHLGGEGGQEVFPLREGDGISKEENGEASSRNEVATSLTKDYHKAPLNRGESYVIHDKRQAGEFRLQKQPSVTKHYGTGGGNVPYIIDYRNQKEMDVSAAILGNDHNTVHRVALPQISNAVDCDGYLRQMGVHHDKPLCHYRIRRLTPIECERLQGFPDNWTEGVSDTQRYKMLGNAVTVNVVKEIGLQIKRIIIEKTPSPAAIEGR